MRVNCCINFYNRPEKSTQQLGFLVRHYNLEHEANLEEWSFSVLEKSTQRVAIIFYFLHDLLPPREYGILVL